MKVIIQCAASKAPDAGCMVTPAGERVLFVADPSLVGSPSGVVYAHPDDVDPDGISWRAKLVTYNQRPVGNPLRLLPAVELYSNAAYREAARHVGVDNLYILSAGWGLITGNFLTPLYDITFSGSAEPYKRRTRQQRFDDLQMLRESSDEPVVFFGGKDYLPIFLALTSRYKGRRIVFYNSDRRPKAPGVSVIRYPTSMRTNWHYDAVTAFVNGRLGLDEGT